MSDIEGLSGGVRVRLGCHSRRLTSSVPCLIHTCESPGFWATALTCKAAAKASRDRTENASKESKSCNVSNEKSKCIATTHQNVLLRLRFGPNIGTFCLASTTCCRLLGANVIDQSTTGATGGEERQRNQQDSQQDEDYAGNLLHCLSFAETQGATPPYSGNNHGDNTNGQTSVRTPHDTCHVLRRVVGRPSSCTTVHQF